MLLVEDGIAMLERILENPDDLPIEAYVTAPHDTVRSTKLELCSVARSPL